MSEAQRISRLVILGDGDDRILIRGSQSAEILDVFDRAYLFVSDGSVVIAEYDEDDDLWRVEASIEWWGTAEAVHRGPVLDEVSERLEPTGSDLRVFAVTIAEETYSALCAAPVTIGELLEPARLCLRDLAAIDPRHKWAEDAGPCDPAAGILPLERVLERRDAMKEGRT